LVRGARGADQCLSRIRTLPRGRGRARRSTVPRGTERSRQRVAGHAPPPGDTFGPPPLASGRG
jgi:hypothetical protein